MVTTLKEYIEEKGAGKHLICSYTSDQKRCSLFNDYIDFFYMQADNANAIIEEISIRGRWVNPGGSREMGTRSVGKRVIPLGRLEEIPLIDEEISSKLLSGVPKITKNEYDDFGYIDFTYTLDLSLEYIICERYYTYTDYDNIELSQYMSGYKYPEVYRIE